MKRILLTIIFLYNAFAFSYAQYYLSVGYQRLHFSSEQKGMAATHANGIALGVTRNCRLGHGWGLAPGVYFSASTGKEPVRLWDDIILDQKSYDDVGVEIPLNLTWSHQTGSSSSIFFFGGPTFQAGLISKVKESGENRYSPDGGPRRFNVFAGGGIGFSVQKIAICAGYRHGLLAPYPNHSSRCGVVHCTLALQL